MYTRKKSVIPIHLYITHIVHNYEKLVSIIEDAYSRGVSYFWVEAEDKDCINAISDIVQKLNTKVVAVIKNPALLGSLIEEKIDGIATSFQYSKNLISFKNEILKKNLNIYLNVKIQDDKYLNAYVNDLLNGFYDLKNSGIQNIHLYINHSEIVTYYNLNRELKKVLNSPIIFSIAQKDQWERSLISNSMLSGGLLAEGICNEILIRPDFTRKSFYAMVEQCKAILRALKLYPNCFKVISCPTCGRCRMDVLKMARKVNKLLEAIEDHYNKGKKSLEDIGGIVIAVMGCNVNGPGEASHADIGIAGGRNKTGTIFVEGKPLVTISEDKIIPEFESYLKEIIGKRFGE